MSAQSGKKKRIGSRRRVANQNKTSEADEFHVTDSTSVALPFLLGENSDTLNAFDNSDNSQSETQKPPSPELPVNRKKLGSSRRNKGGQHVKESELYLKSREKVEEQTRGNETEKTLQPQRQEELSKWTESVTDDSSLLANTPDYSSEIRTSTTTNCSDADLESCVPKSENLLADKDEISTDNKVVSDSFKLVEAKHGGTDKTDTLQGEELIENAETFGISELTTASVTVKDDKERHEGKELLKQDGNLQGNYVVSESHLKLEFSITAEVTTDKSSPRENIRLEYSVGQAAFSSSNEKLQIDEEKNEDFNVSEDKVAQHSEDAFNKVHKQEANPTEMHEINHSPDRVTQGENSEVISVYLTDKAEASDANQSESMLESADDSVTRQEDSDDKQDEHPTKQDDLKALEQTNEDTTIPQISGIEQGDSALGQVCEVEGQVEIRGKEALETTQMLAAIERSSPEEFSQGSENDIVMPTTHDSSLYADIVPDYSSEVQNVNTSNYPETDLESLAPTSENLQEDDNESESDFKVSDESVGDRLEEMDKLDTVQSQEVRAAQHSEDAGNKVHEQEVSFTQMHDIDHSSKSVTLDATEKSEIISDNLTDEATKQEDSNPDDKQGVHPAKEDNLEASEQINEDDNVYDTKQVHIDDIERVDAGLAQGYEIEGRVEDDIKPSTEQSVLQEKEGHSSEDEEDRSLQTLPSEIYPPSDSQPQQSDTNFKPIGNRRKLGSSRRLKGRQQAKDSVAESYHRPTEVVVGHTEDNESIQATNMSFTTETAVQEKSVETIQEGIDTHDTAQTEEVKQYAHIGISQSTASSLLFSTAGQQLTDQSDSTKMPEELPNVYSVTEKESKDGDKYTELLRQNGNLQDNFLVRESHLKSEDIEFSITAEIDTEYNSSTEHTEPQCSVEIVSSPKEELSTHEETMEHSNLYEVKVAQHSDDVVHKVHDQEVKPTEMHEIAHYSDNVTHDATEKSEIIYDNLTDKAEVSNTNQSESMFESTDDPASKQEDSDPDEKQDEHPTKQDDLKALEQTIEDTKIPQNSGMEQGDSALGQVYEVKGQLGDDIIPSAEQTIHQEKEGLISEMEESDSSSQTLQSEIHAPFDSQPQQNDTDLHPLGSRRKLGSSRRHRGRQHAKDSVAESYHEAKDEVVESVRGKEALETTQMLAAIERTSPEEFSQGSENDIVMPTTHDSSLYADIMPDYSSEVQNVNTSDYPENDLKTLAPKTENLQEDDNEKESDFKVSDESVGDRLEEMDKLDTVQSQEVRAAQHSEDAGNKVHEQEVNLTQMHDIDHSSESVTLDATEKAEIISDNLTDQAEDNDTIQSELIVESTDDSATKQEDSNPDDKQAVHPAKDENLEASEQINEDDNVYDTKQVHIDDIERVDAGLAQDYEIEGRVEDDIKPNTEQSVLQEKEGHSSEDDEDRSLQTLPSEIYPPSDSQPQQSDTNFKPIGNRRKLGSSRRLKGRQQAKDSVAESYHRPTEVVVGHTEENESIQTTNMSFTTKTAVQEKSVETIQEGIDTHDTAQTEEVKQYAHIGISQSTASSLLFSTAGQQLIDQSDSTKMPEELPNVYSVTEKESKDGDKYTELLRQDGNLQDNFLVRESHLKSEDTEFSITAEIATEYNSSTEHTEPQCSVEIVSSPKEELSTHEETMEQFNSYEVKVAQHSDNAVHKMHEQEVKPTEMHEIAHYSDNVTHDATEKFEIISGNLTDKAEVSNENQSELMLESTDDLASKQEDSDPDEKQDEHPTKQDDLKVLEQTIEDTKIPQISGIKQVDSALGQVYEVEGQVGDDIIPSAEQTIHQEKEGLISEMEESDSSSQTLQSEIHAPFDSQPQQNDTDLHPLGSRRKLGSSRRHRGRQHAKDSVAESYHEAKVVESIRGKEALETTQMLAAIERTSPEEFSQGSENDIDMPTTHDSSLYADIMPDYSSEVQNVNTSKYPKTDLESLAPKSENLQEDDNERESDFKVSGESVGDRLEEMNKLDTVQSQEIRAAQHSEDAGNKVHEQEVNLTQMHDIDHSSESVTLLDNLTDQAEDSDTIQSELIVESTDDSATKQEDSNPDDKQGVHPAKEDNLEASEQTNEDDNVYDTKQVHSDDIERVDAGLAQGYEIEGRVEDDIKPSTEQSVLQEKEGHSSEDEEDRPLQTLPSEIYPPSDSQPQQSDTNFKPIGNRRKLGSSRRLKGRQQAKDSVAESYHRPTEVVVGHTEDNESIQTTNMSFTTETAVQEKSVETIQEGIDTHDTAQTEDVNDQVKENAAVGIFELTASSLHSSATVDELLVDQTSSRKMPEEERPNLYSVTERKSKHKDKDTELLGLNENMENDLLRESHLREEADSSVMLEKDTEQHSLGEQTDIECSVEQAAFSSSKDIHEAQKEHVSLSQVRGSPRSEDAVNEVHEELVNFKQVQEMYQIGFSSTEESESLQTLQSETNAPLDSQHQDNSLRREEQTTRNRRKLGSSRRNKGRQQVEKSVAESYHEHKEDVVETRNDGVLDPTKMSFAVETARQEEGQKQPDLDLRSVPKIRKIRSTVKDEDTVLSQKIIDNSTNETTNVASTSSKDDKSNKDYNEEEKNVTKEPENSYLFTGHDTVKTDLIQSPEDDSDIQNISYHDDYVTARPITLDVLEQEDMNMQQTNGATETAGDVSTKDCDTEAETSTDVRFFGERFEDPPKKDQEMNASQEVARAELFAAVQNKADTSAPSGPKGNFRAEPAMDVPEESRIFTEVGVSDSHQGIQEKTQLDNSGNLQGKSKQKRRKLGSTRRTQLGRKPEEGVDDKDETKDSDDMRNLDKMEVVEVLPTSVTAEVSKNENTKPSLSTEGKEQESTETAAVPDKGQKLQSYNADLQSIQSNMISDIDYSKAILPEQLASNIKVVNPVMFAHAADIRNSERNVDVNVEPSQLDDFTVSEMHVTSVFTQSDIERPESVNVIQDQALESAEASAGAVADLEIVKSVVRGEVGEEQKHAQASVQDLREVNEEAHNKNLEMRSASPHRRRKMGSTRRNLGSRSKREDLHEKQDMDDEATAANVEGVKTERFQSIKEKEEPRLETEGKESENVESHFRPPSEQTFEENPVLHGQAVETEHQLTPSYLSVMPSTSPKPDVMSEAAGGRRRKMGSSRKSRGQQSNVNQTPGEDRVTDTQNGGDVASVIDEGVIKTAEEESFGLDKISEVDKSAKKSSSNISTSKMGEHLKPVSEKTPAHVTTVQHPYAEIRLSQESQQTLSLAGSLTGAASRSNRYNVLMVGDSSVGKTSFIKRAQSGKFSLDLPASVGIDSFMWTVVVDGKPVVLQLWDTAGQERFHSITRQIFHKAQAFLLMYDITSSQSFSAVSYWANCIQEGATEDVTILLLGNKSDHAKRQIKFQEGEILAKEYNFEFMECSAATGENVIQSLETVARMLSQKVEPREETTVLHKEPQQKKSSGCC